MSKFSKITKQQNLGVCSGESVKFLGITSVSQDPPLKRELSTRQCERLLIGMTTSTGDISRIVFVSGGYFESFKIYYLANMVNPTYECPPKH